MVKKLTKKQWWIGILIAIVAVMSVSIGYRILTTPQNLGSKLEYIGTYNAGCEWWQIPFYMGWCSGPSNDYYFATDMTENEIKSYFSQASPSGQDGNGTGSSANYTFKEISFNTKNNTTFGVYYYDNTSKIISLKHLKETTKSHVISISASDYNQAKSAL